MRQVDLHEGTAYLWRELLKNILCRDAPEGDGGSLTCVSQVIEAGWEVGVPYKAVRCGAGKVCEGNGGMASIGSIDKGVEQCMTQAC